LLLLLEKVFSSKGKYFKYKATFQIFFRGTLDRLFHVTYVNLFDLPVEKIKVNSIYKYRGHSWD
jgi:hypothetical protein